MKFINSAILLTIMFITSCNLVAAQTSSKKKSTSTKAKYFSEDHALKCIEDYYDFYNADEHYLDPRIRRVSNNVFYVSVKYCIGGEEICFERKNIGTWDNPIYITGEPKEFFWNSKVLVLTCTSETKYKVRVKGE